MNYRKTFDPSNTQTFDDSGHVAVADGRDRSVYVYTPEIVLAVNVALATGRPLLVRGPSGCGKSTLARNVARTLQRRYYEEIISSRTEARDLLWRIDLLRRLQDAQAGQLAPDYAPYVVPGVLWWAFHRESALAQTHRAVAGDSEPGEYVHGPAAVVLLDEIDKADPDVPNNLLVPLGSLTFTVDETGESVRAGTAPLVLITTNDERDLPPAFVRRCVELRMSGPTRAQLVEVGRVHFHTVSEDLLHDLASRFAPDGGESEAVNPPSTAEYLDTLRACVTLDVQPGSPLFDQLARVTVWKHGRRPPGGGTA